VGSADPPQSADWAKGELDSAELRGLGIELVVEWLGTPGRLPTTHDGLVEVLREDGFAVWAVRG